MTVQGPVKEQQPDGMSHRGGKWASVPSPRKSNFLPALLRDSDVSACGPGMRCCEWFVVLGLVSVQTLRERARCGTVPTLCMDALASLRSSLRTPASIPQFTFRCSAHPLIPRPRIQMAPSLAWDTIPQQFVTILGKACPSGLKPSRRLVEGVSRAADTNRPPNATSHRHISHCSITLVDTPGVLETADVHSRSYDYIEVCLTEHPVAAGGRSRGWCWGWGLARSAKGPLSQETTCSTTISESEHVPCSEVTSGQTKSGTSVALRTWARPNAGAGHGR